MNYSPNTRGLEETNIAGFVRARAYQLYLARNCEPHHELDDWLTAELEVLYHFGRESAHGEKSTMTDS